MSSTTVPSPYASLGASRGWRPTPPQKLLVFLVGEPGTGKSTLVASIPECFVLDTEGRLHDVVHNEATYFNYTDMTDYIKLLDKLIEDGKAGKHPCKVVAIDTIDTYLTMYAAHITKNKGSDYRTWPHGTGYTALSDHLCGKLRALALAGYGWVITAHLKKNAIFNEQGECTRIVREPNLYNSTLMPLHALCQIQATCLRTTEQPTKVKEIKVRGVVKEKRTVNDGPRRTVFALSMRPGGDNSNDKERTDAKNPYLDHLAEVIRIPGRNGYTAFATEYLTAMETIQKQLSSESLVATPKPHPS